MTENRGQKIEGGGRSPLSSFRKPAGLSGIQLWTPASAGVTTFFVVPVGQRAKAGKQKTEDGSQRAGDRCQISVL